MGGGGGDGDGTLGKWNVTSLGGKEPELVREVERYWLDLVGLASMHSIGSGSKLLERGWTLFFSGVAKGVRCRVGMGILTSPRLSAAVLGVYPGGREGRLPPWSYWGTSMRTSTMTEIPGGA